MSFKKHHLCCIVPAAGIGQRMQSNKPKQYLPFCASTILDHTLERLLSCDHIEMVIVVTGNDDPYWPSSNFYNDPRIMQVVGGKERSDSVLNGLIAAEKLFGEDVWVMVHDGARPCLMKSDIELLIEYVTNNNQGAILVAPVHDTVKKVTNSNLETLDRNKILRALTPQLFGLIELKQAIINANNSQQQITDEAHAIELMGKSIGYVEGRADNIKVTTPADLSLANYYVKQQENL